MGKNRRDIIKMSEAELWEFIQQQKSLQVGTLNKDGSIHLSTLWFGIKDKCLVFETYTKSQKILNLQRDPRITVLMDAGEVYEELRGVSISGTAELYDKPEDVEGLATLVLARNNPEWEAGTAKKAAEMLASKRTAVVIQPEKTVTWDHTKLGGTY